jgi:hypothetical protein
MEYKNIDNFILLHNRYSEILIKLSENKDLTYEPSDTYICHKELNCNICYNDVKIYDIKKIDCKHNLCKECYKRWDKYCLQKNIITTCPICRNILHPNLEKLKNDVKIISY